LWLAAVAVGAWPFILVRTLRYRISNYRIDYERGIFSKNIDTLELYGTWTTSASTSRSPTAW
jgi:hypothetical protein